MVVSSLYDGNGKAEFSYTFFLFQDKLTEDQIAGECLFSLRVVG